MSKSGFGEAPIKGEGMEMDYGHGEAYVIVKETIPKTWIEFRVPVHLEDECWEMIKQWLKDRGATHD
jgi:hypothetical protein